MLSLSDQINERLGIIEDLRRDLVHETSPVKKRAVSQTIQDLQMQVGSLRKEMVLEAKKKPPKPSSDQSSSGSSSSSCTSSSSSSSSSDSSDSSSGLPLGEKPDWRRRDRKVEYGADGCPKF
jgi:hypothetical protein